jgi:MYXO-CTERM domain-containing protein
VILSGQIGVDPDASPLAIVLFPTMVGLAILLWRRRRRIDPALGQFALAGLR